MKSARPWLFLAAAALMSSGAGPVPAAEPEYGASEAAVEIARRAMLVDTHIDVPDRLTEAWSDVTVATKGGDFDYERARRGGLDIPFMSIYTPPESEAEGTSFELANRLIDQVEALAGRAPGKFALVHNPLQAEEAWKSGLIGLALGMENGSPIAGRLDNLAFFKRRGISYITLAHSLSNHLADSSYDRNRQWNGLSPFGREAVAEMNRLGIMIDVSHLTDEAFFQVLELSRAPVIASHSSARHFTPGWERNMSDEMIRALADRGGLVMINFGSAFLTRAAQQWYERMDQARDAFVNGNGFDEHGPEAREFEQQYRAKDPLPYANLDDVVAHFQHVIGLVGIQHVGIGSDFDGVGDSLPEGLKDVSFYPNLVERLLRLNHPLRDIEAILGGNLMRVWREVEEQARQAAGS